MSDRRLSRARELFGILILVLALGAFGVFGAFSATTAAMAAGTDPDDGSSMDIVVTVPPHSTPSPSVTPWPPASPTAPSIPHDSDGGSGSTDADGWLSGTGLGWQVLVVAAAALLVTLFGVALRRGTRRAARGGAGRGA